MSGCRKLVNVRGWGKGKGEGGSQRVVGDGEGNVVGCSMGAKKTVFVAVPITTRGGEVLP